MEVLALEGRARVKTFTHFLQISASRAKRMKADFAFCLAHSNTASHVFQPARSKVCMLDTPEGQSANMNTQVNTQVHPFGDGCMP